jgi:predicted TIM-barrel fold metal-dependent hydrolase
MRVILLSLLIASSAWSRPPIVDVHVHTEPQRFALVTDLLAANGISRFINLSGGSTKAKLSASLTAAAPYDDRVLICANLRWSTIDGPDFVARQVQWLETAAAMGARCLKISKALGLGVPDFANETQLLAVDDRRLDPIWEAAGRLKLPVFMHTGDPKAFFEPLGPQNERMAELGVHPDWSFHDPQYPRRDALLAARDRVLTRHRGTTFVGVHFANNPEDLAYVDRTLDAHPNLYVDVAARLPEIGRHDPAKVRAVFIKHQRRILFGTDIGVHQNIMLGSVGRTRPMLPDVFLFYADHFRFFETDRRKMPHPTPIQGDWTIDGIALPEAVLRRIYAENALALFWGIQAPNAVDETALWLAPYMADFFP